MSYSENKPSPQRPCFLSDQNFFKESERGPPKEHLCQIIMKSIKPFWRRRFLKFYYMSYSKNKPRPRRPCFLPDQNFFKESKRGPPKEHLCQIIMNSIQPFWRRRSLKFFGFVAMATRVLHRTIFFEGIQKRTLPGCF